MALDCAHCDSMVCRGGLRDAGPEFCPMLGDFPEFEKLYQEENRLRLAVQAALVEGEGYCRWTRIREIAEFSRKVGFGKLGLAHCPDTSEVASRAAGVLKEEGLEALLPPAAEACAPVEQARFFETEQTELNVLTGMCVAHEALFLKSSHVPATALVARDARLRHNPAAALYTSRSYLQAELHGHWPPDERPDYCGDEAGSLERVAREMAEAGEGFRSRVAEAMEVAHRLGATHIGVSFCSGFREEAKLLHRVLKTNGFRVSSVCCKTGAVPKAEVGIQDQDQVRPGRPEMICNPLTQAELLNREGVELALVLGQCVGHDAATLQRLEAPAACIVAKDRVLAHNTVAGFL